MSLVKHALGFFALVTLVVGCAAEPAEPAEETVREEPAAEEENVGQVAEELKWSKPLCAYIRWTCGACICDACNVVDCRNASTATTTLTAN